jgi:hypothetical protein
VRAGASRLELLRSLSSDLSTILGLLVLAALALVLYWRPWSRGDRSYRRGQFKPYIRIDTDKQYDRTDSADQLRAVMSATFTPSKIMTGSEYRVFRITEAEVADRHEGSRVFAQTSLGEVIRSENRDAHSAINSKRVDVLVIGRSGLPLVAIEYQGKGHYQNDAAARDAVKKEALRKAGVAYLEVFDFQSDEEIRRAVRETLVRVQPSPPTSPSAAPANSGAAG